MLYQLFTNRISNISCKTFIVAIFFIDQGIFYNSLNIFRIGYIGKSVTNIICRGLNMYSPKTKYSAKKSLRALNIIDFI